MNKTTTKKDRSINQEDLLAVIKKGIARALANDNYKVVESAARLAQKVAQDSDNLMPFIYDIYALGATGFFLEILQVVKFDNYRKSLLKYEKEVNEPIQDMSYEFRPDVKYVYKEVENGFDEEDNLKIKGIVFRARTPLISLILMTLQKAQTPLSSTMVYKFSQAYLHLFPSLQESENWYSKYSGDTNRERSIMRVNMNVALSQLAAEGLLTKEGPDHRYEFSITDDKVLEIAKLVVAKFSNPA